MRKTLLRLSVSPDSMRSSSSEISLIEEESEVNKQQLEQKL